LIRARHLERGVLIVRLRGRHEMLRLRGYPTLHHIARRVGIDQDQFRDA
jgi:hypothetical protein